MLETRKGFLSAPLITTNLSLFIIVVDMLADAIREGSKTELLSTGVKTQVL